MKLFLELIKLKNYINTFLKKPLVQYPLFKPFLGMLCFCLLFWAAQKDPEWVPLMQRVVSGLVLGATLPLGALVSSKLLTPLFTRWLLGPQGQSDFSARKFIPEQTKSSTKHCIPSTLKRQLKKLRKIKPTQYASSQRYMCAGKHPCLLTQKRRKKIRCT